MDIVKFNLVYNSGLIYNDGLLILLYYTFPAFSDITDSYDLGLKLGNIIYYLFYPTYEEVFTELNDPDSETLIE